MEKANISGSGIKILVFVLKTNCVLCVSGMELLYIITYDIYILKFVVPLLGVLVSTMSPQRTFFHKWSFRVGFMENKFH
jgi:hypothetical protein